MFGFEIARRSSRTWLLLIVLAFQRAVQRSLSFVVLLDGDFSPARSLTDDPKKWCSGPTRALRYDLRISVMCHRTPVGSLR
jgi:hypothetical protein